MPIRFGEVRPNGIPCPIFDLFGKMMEDRLVAQFLFKELFYGQ